MKRQYSHPKNAIASAVTDWDDVVVIGMKAGEPQFLSSADEQRTESLLGKADLRAFEPTTG